MIILTLLLAQALCYTPSDCVAPQVCTAMLDGVTPGTCIMVEPEPLPDEASAKLGMPELPPPPPEPEPEPEPPAPPPPETDPEPIMIEVPDLELERDVPVLRLNDENEEPEDEEEPEKPFFLAPVINPVINLFRRAVVSPAQALFCWLTQC